MSYSQGWLVNAIKYLENSVFIYRNGLNIALPIENSQRLDRLNRYVTSYAEVALQSGTLLFTPYTYYETDESGTEKKVEVTDPLEAISKIEEKKEANDGNLIDTIEGGRGEGQDFTVSSSNVYEALNSLAKEISNILKSGGTGLDIVDSTNVYEGFELEP